MDANKKIDLENPLCPNESKLLANILQNHPLRFSIASSSSVPWIYLGQFWHTLKEDGSKYKLSFVFDRKELNMNPDDFRTIFHLPQATDNNHDRLVPAPKFLEMVLFYINNLSFTLKLRSPSNFKTTSLVQPWQTLCKMFSRCLTTQVTRYGQPPLQIMQMIFTKLIVSHYMTAFPEISRRAHDKYHNLEDNEMVKSIFNSGKNKAGARMKISSLMITNEIKLTDNYQMKTSAPRTPNPDVAEGDSSASRNLRLLDFKIHEDLEAKQNEEKDKEHLMAEEIEKLVEGTENLEENELQGRYRYLFEHLKTRFKPRKKFYDLAQHLQEVMEESLPKMVDTRIKALTKTQSDVADAIQQECENLWAEISSQINNVITNHIPSQFDSSVRNYMSRHILHTILGCNKFERLHASDTSCRPSAIRLRDHDDPHDDAHPEGENSAKRQKTSEHGIYVFEESPSGQDNKSEPDDDVLPIEKVSQELVEEMSQTVDEAKLCKVVNETCQRDPKAPSLSLVNQDLLYLKKGNSGPDKIVMSLHKFPVKQKEPEKSKEIVYSNSKIVQIIKFFWELGHEHKFITKIIARRTNGSTVSITESDYKNLNKNDIEDLYLLIINGKVDDFAETRLLWSLSVFIRSTVIWERVHDFQLGVESYQQNVSLIAPTITFPGIEKYKMFSIISKPVYGIIYKNSKKENRVMRHQEVHKFCDATLKRVLKGLKSYNNNIKHGYVTPSLSKEDVECLQLFEEDIEERLKHHDQMRRWEMYVNKRPLGSRRERPE
ncbi:hypothetical protein Tco_0603926 [Tanacetum coccineum]